MSWKSDHPWHRYDVISTFQHGGRGIANLLPVHIFVTWIASDGQNLLTYQIPSKSYHRDGDITPYWLAAALQIYFGFSFLSCGSLEMGKVYQHIKFSGNPTIGDRDM